MQFSKIEDLGLQELLERAASQLSLRYLPLAQCRGRQEMPTPRTVQLNAHLIATLGDKWLQLLVRQAGLDYQMVFTICIRHGHTYPALIQIAGPSRRKELAVLQQKIWEMIESRTTGLQLQWNLFACLIRKYLDDDFQNESGQFLIRIERMMRTNLFREDMKALYELQLPLSDETIQESFSTVFDLHELLLKLFIKIKKNRLKCMSYLLFAANHSAFIQWAQNSLIDAISFLEQAKNRKMLRNTIGERMYSSALCCLVQFAEITEVEGIAQKHCQRLVNFLVMEPLLLSKPTKIHDQIIDGLNFQYGLIMNEYGDDNPSLLAKTIVRNASNLPSFLRTYLSALGAPQILQFIKEDEMILKLAIVHKQLKKREDLVLIMQPFLQNLFKGIDLLPNMIDSHGLYCRKLRLLYFYSPILKQRFFVQLLQKCMFMLNMGTGETYIFSEACFIFQEILKSHLRDLGEGDSKVLSRISMLLKQNVYQLCLRFMEIVQSIYSKMKTVGSDQKLLKILQLLHRLISENQNEVNNINTKIMQNLSTWLLIEVESAWQKGLKTTPVINELMGCIQLVKNLIVEDYYIVVSSSVYSILALLASSHNLDIEDGLLEVLIFVMNMQHQISPQISTILISLGRLTQRYRGNLYPIIGVIKAFCDKRLVNNVLYQWNDLITFFLNLFIQFFTSFATNDYRNLYEKELAQQVFTFERFLEAYGEYFKENRQSRLNALQCINAMPNNQYQIRLFLILNHQEPIEGFNFYCLANVQAYHYRSTMKLIYFMYVDGLMRNYSEKLTNDFLQFHLLFREKTQRRDLRSQQFESSPYQQLSINIVVLQGFRWLLLQQKIDMMDFNSLRKQFHLDD